MRGVVEHIDRKQLRGRLTAGEAPARPATIEVLWQGSVVAEGEVAKPGAFAIDLPPIEGFAPRAAASALRVRAAPTDGSAPQELPVADALALQLGWRAPAAMPEGRIAYLVLCARAPAIFGRTVRALRDARDAVFAHVDSKIAQQPFEEAAAGCGVHFVAERIDVTWGTFRMIEAELALIRAARAAGGFERFVLLSDDSFPLRPVATIRAAVLSGRVGVPARAMQPKDRYFLDRYEQFHFFGTRSAREGRRGYDAADAPALRELAAFMETQGKKPVRLHHGSQWVVLSAADVEAIIEADADQHLRRSFVYSMIPDEHYFHTILAERPGFVARPDAMYFDWSVTPGPRVFHAPEETLDALWSRRLFVRKIAPDALPVVEFLEAEITGGPPPAAVVAPPVSDAVLAVHPHWRAVLHLDLRLGRLRHEEHGSTGSFRLADGRLEVAWDRHAPETFAWRDGVYVHLSLLALSPGAR
jgi:hypothetical protein